MGASVGNFSVARPHHIPDMLSGSRLELRPNRHRRMRKTKSDRLLAPPVVCAESKAGAANDVDSSSPFNVEPSGPIDDRSLARLSWRCRRGMLENDLVLSRFLARRGATLRGDELAALGELLDLSDNDLWEIISGHAEPSDPRLAPLVAQLRVA